MSKENKLLTNRIDYSLLVVVIIITFFGIYMILSATYYSNIFGVSNNPLIDFMSDLKKIAIGLAVMIVAIFFKAKLIKRFSPALMIVSIIFLILTLFIGKEINYAKRWIYFGSYSLATSELAKFASILYFAKILENMKKNAYHYKRAMLNVIVFASISIFLIVLQPDFSTAVLYGLILGTMLLVAGMKWKHIGILMLVGSILAASLIYIAPYRWKRFTETYTKSDFEYQGDVAQVNKSLLSIAEGKFFGVGPGKAYQTKNGIPQAESDFIFSTIAETTGFLGSILLISAYIFLLWRMYRIALLTTSFYASLVTVGFASMVGFQAVIQLLYTTKLLPVTGIPLPFISSGGTSTILMLAGVGIVLNFSSLPEGI